MIDSPSRFEDDAWNVIWLFPGSELDMRGDRFSIFGEFRSVCKIWTNSYGTIYRDRKNHLRLSSLDYPPSRKYLSSLEDAVLSLLSFACSFPLPLLVFIAKDVVAKGLDHDTFVLSIREIKPKKLDTEPVRSQLRGDFLLGRDQAE
ncbi:hypothetical protein F2Q68_00014601 [Brassica cretica]|uniref:Uncharacterized protein n=1 Tax=Brassica cretica TaxID=69181 RepID=A0A8S9HCX1_BRACR|nr:hypothetical protein F2Q68_00014601 [Brassica cretica]